MLDRFRHLLPSNEEIQRNRWLRWLGPALQQPRLWCLSRRGIALGVALGIFFGLLIPVAQISVSAAAAVALRANLPAAVASTLVTNPATFGPIYYAAWWVGDALIGDADASPQAPPAVQPAAEPAAGEGWIGQALGRVAGVGKPLVLGLAIFAMSFGLLSYLLVSLVWAVRVRMKRRRRVTGRPRPGTA